MNSTLQRLVTLEAEVAKNTTAMNALAAVPVTVIKLEQALNDFGGKVQGAFGQVNGKFAKIEQILQTSMSRMVALEQSVEELGKILSALSSELSDNKAISSASVMERVRKSEDLKEKGRVEQMLAAKYIQAADVVSIDSLLTVSQSVKQADESLKTLTDCFVLDLNPQHSSDEARTELVGKKVGDVLTKEVDGQTIITTVTGIYVYANIKKDGDTPIAEAALQQVAQ